MRPEQISVRVDTQRGLSKCHSTLTPLALPTSEAVNKALASVLAFAEEAKSLTAGKTNKSTKRRAA
jgi:hypothetical protein